jgi:hypothetical protein
MQAMAAPVAVLAEALQMVLLEPELLHKVLMGV